MFLFHAGAGVISRRRGNVIGVLEAASHLMATIITDDGAEDDNNKPKLAIDLNAANDLA